jgi:hypothetical protein
MFAWTPALNPLVLATKARMIAEPIMIPKIVSALRTFLSSNAFAPNLSKSAVFIQVIFYG